MIDIEAIRLTSEHTRILREAGGELREYSARIAQRGYEAVSNLRDKATTFDIRAALEPTVLAPSLRKSWTRIHGQTTSILIATGALLNPRDVSDEAFKDVFAGSAIVDAPDIGLRNGTLAFFEARRNELELLGDSRGFEMFGPLLWTTLVHDRSSLLRGAFYNGVIYPTG